MKIGLALLAWGALAVNPAYSSAPATAPGALKTSARRVGQSHAAAIGVCFIDIKPKQPHTPRGRLQSRRFGYGPGPRLSRCDVGRTCDAPRSLRYIARRQSRHGKIGSAAMQLCARGTSRALFQPAVARSDRARVPRALGNASRSELVHEQLGRPRFERRTCRARLS